MEIDAIFREIAMICADSGLKMKKIERFCHMHLHMSFFFCNFATDCA